MIRAVFAARPRVLSVCEIPPRAWLWFLQPSGRVELAVRDTATCSEHERCVIVGADYGVLHVPADMRAVGAGKTLDDHPLIPMPIDRREAAAILRMEVQ